MRITNHYATQQAIAAFNAAREQMDIAQQQATTGRRVVQASDDPAAARSIMQNDSEQRTIDQNQRTIDSATSRLATEEGALDQITSLLTRAKELAIAQASDTSNPTTRKAVAAEANELLAQAVQIANTKQDGSYLFGGRTPGTAPFTIDSSGSPYTFTASIPAPQGPLLVDVGGGQMMASSHDGATVFGDGTTGALASLQSLAAALAGGAAPAITAAIPGIDTALQATQVLTAENGARTNRLQAATASIKTRTDQSAADTSSVRDVDVESAMTESIGRQTAFQAAMAATAKIFSMSLTDYLT